MNDYTMFTDLDQLIPEIPADSIISRTIFQDEGVKVVLFGFAAGQALSEHTAAKPAILHFVRGQATLTLGDQSQAAAAHTWVHMPAHLPHSVTATTETIMLLLLLG